jgi:ribosomal protein L37E
MRFNSTIIPKKKICRSCGKPCYHFSKGRCQPCATREDSMKRIEKYNEEVIGEKGLQELIEEADSVFSQWVRLSAADANGIIRCFICGKKVHWKKAENMHYVKRGVSLFLRFDPRNNKAGCHECNVIKDGNYIEYAKKLDAENPGITDILYEESNLRSDITRADIKQLIAEYSLKVKELKPKVK